MDHCFLLRQTSFVFDESSRLVTVFSSRWPQMAIENDIRGVAFALNNLTFPGLVHKCVTLDKANFPPSERLTQNHLRIKLFELPQLPYHLHMCIMTPLKKLH